MQHVTVQAMDYFNVSVLREIVHIERGLEVERQAMALCPQFALETAHAIFAESPSQRLAHSELMDGLHRLGVRCESRDVHLLMARYDSDMDGRLGFWEFAKMFLPTDPRLSREVEARRATHLCGEIE